MDREKTEDAILNNAEHINQILDILLELKNEIEILKEKMQDEKRHFHSNYK